MLRTRSGSAVAKAAVVATILLSSAPLARAAGDDGAAKANEKPAADSAQPAPTKGAEPKRISPLDTVEAGPFSESTDVQGKINTDLKGVWLLVTNAEVAPGKFKNFPQLIKVTKGKKGPEFHLLDVQLPEAVQQSLKEAQLGKWQPSADQRKALAKQWSQLPPAKQKTFDDFLYAKIEYVVASPDHYDALGQRSRAMTKVLEGSKFSMRITEDYKARELPPGSRVAQLAQRVTVYAVKTADKDMLTGDQALGFVAVAPVPVPLEFSGPFVMYRLAPL